MKRSTYALAALLLVISLAHAHSKLTSSMPTDKEALASAPNEVVLHFSEPVRLTAVTVTRSGGEKQDLSGIPGELMKDFTITAPELADGEYNVSWRALAPDSHIMTGTFTFSVGAAGSASHGEHTASHAQPAPGGSHQH